MTAEYAMRTNLGSDDNIVVRSAGLIQAPHEVASFVKEYLESKQIDIARHKPRVLDHIWLEAADLPVAMSTDHREKIAEQFGRHLPLFSEIAYGSEEPLRDVDEVVPNWRNNEAAAQEYAISVMDYIFDGMPCFLDRMNLLLAPGVCFNR